MNQDEQYDLALADRLLKFNSYMFWSQVMKIRNQSLYRAFWEMRDYPSYMQTVGTCKICDDFRIILLQQDTQIPVVEQFHIHKVYCLCETLRILSDGKPRPWESPINPRAHLGQIKPIDVPPGAKVGMEKILKTCTNWISNPSKWMLLTGGTGTAKSHILFSLRIAMGGFGYYITASDFNQTLLSAVREGELMDDIIARVMHAPFLFVDDFGMEHRSERNFGLNVLSHIIDQRYLLGASAPVLMATNHTLTELHTHELEQVVRIGSRMMDSDLSLVSIFDQADYRLKRTKDLAAGVK